MTSFTYRAVHTTGDIRKGTLTAANENELAFHLRERGLELISAKPSRPRPLNLKRDGIRLEETQQFCKQMHDLLSAGLAFAPALGHVVEALENGPLHDRLSQVASLIAAGSTITKAFAAQGGLFTPVYLAILSAGEASGDLIGTFDRLAMQLERDMNLKRQVSRAVRYPVLLLCIVAAVTSFMLFLVVPQISSFLLGLGQDLPLSTRALIKGAELFSLLWWSGPLLLALVILIYVIARAQSHALAILLDGCLLRLPVIGSLWRKLALARLTTSFAILLKSGLAMPQALRFARASLGNQALKKQAQQAEEALLQGAKPSEALGELFTPNALQMLKIGEKSGHLPSALEEIVATYDRDAHTAVDNFLSLLEPALTLCVGALLAWVVLAVLGPLYGSLTPLMQGM